MFVEKGSFKNVSNIVKGSILHCFIDKVLEEQKNMSGPSCLETIALVIREEKESTVPADTS